MKVLDGKKKVKLLALPVRNCKMFLLMFINLVQTSFKLLMFALFFSMLSTPSGS